jgi:hypothetical protein
LKRAASFRSEGTMISIRVDGIVRFMNPQTVQRFGADELQQALQHRHL